MASHGFAHYFPTIGSWGYNRKARYDAYEKTSDLIHLLIETVAFNGNLLLNVGPRADGTMPPIFADRLVGMGEWLEVSAAIVAGCFFMGDSQ